MKKSRFLIALAVLASAVMACAFPVPAAAQAGHPAIAQASPIPHDVAPATVASAGTVQVQAVKDVSPLPLDVAQTECSTCRTAMHPTCGPREQHPMAKGKKGGGGKRCIEVFAVVIGWPDGPQRLVPIGAIDGDRYIRST